MESIDGLVDLCKFYEIQRTWFVSIAAITANHCKVSGHSFATSQCQCPELLVISRYIIISDDVLTSQVAGSIEG